MATVKVKFRKSTVAGKPGSIYYQLCHNGEVKLLAAKIHLYPEYWDTDNDCIAETVQNETAMLGERRIKIDSDLSRLKHIISDFDGRGIKYRRVYRALEKLPSRLNSHLISTASLYTMRV